MSQSIELSLKLHPKQGEAFQTAATEVLYGGAAGSGKSHLIRVAAIYWSSAIAGLQVYLFRRIRDDLIKNHMEGPKGFRALLAGWTSAGFVTIGSCDGRRTFGVVQNHVCLLWNIQGRRRQTPTSGRRSLDTRLA
jgi:hypothetical protein